MTRHLRPRRSPTPAQVAAIRARYAAGGTSQEALAGEYDLHPRLVSYLIHGERWREIGPDGLPRRACEGRPVGKLLPTEVAQIAQIGATRPGERGLQTALARRFGVDPARIAQIWRAHGIGPGHRGRRPGRLTPTQIAAASAALAAGARSYAQLAAENGVAKSTLYAAVQAWRARPEEDR